MGQLRTAKLIDKIAFPGSTFAASGLIPLPQCTEALVEGNTADTSLFTLNDFGNFIDLTLTGKICTIISNPGGNTGDFSITTNDDNTLTLSTMAGDGFPTVYFVHDGAELELQQTADDIMLEAQTNGAATIKKGGQLYTDADVNQISPACTILFNPA